MTDSWLTRLRAWLAAQIAPPAPPAPPPVAAPPPPAAPAAQQDSLSALASEADKALVARFYQEAYGAGDTALIATLFAPTFQLHDLSGYHDAPLSGPTALEEVVSRTRARLPDLVVTVVEQLAAEDGRVLTRFHITFGEAGSGTPYHGVDISHVEGGQIQETWLLWEFHRATEEEEPEDPGLWRWPPWWW